MSMNSAIRIENLGKQYRIGENQAAYRTLRESITGMVKAPAQRFASLLRGEAYGAASLKKEIWALREVSFDVQPGEALGVIGRNGAGKTTLLKILSRITEPTEGRAEIRGRVGSLLEVGTGMHPELTGKENIFLNGAILGMKRADIKRKLDDIVEFSGVEKFINTPMKHYSSGMQVRLAFSISAHLEPDILIVDEVLAVGDAEFQRKCLGKMDEVAKGGRTVLFVSHNIAAILNLCSRGVLIDSGRVVADGAVSEVVDRYLRTAASPTLNTPLDERVDREGDQALKIVGFSLLDGEGRPVPFAAVGEGIKIALTYKTRADEGISDVHVAIGVHGMYDENLFHLSTDVRGYGFEEIPARGVFVCDIPHLCLQPGRYTFNIFATVNGNISDWIQSAGIIEVVHGDFFGSGKLPPPEQGPFIVDHSWHVVRDFGENPGDS